MFKIITRYIAWLKILSFIIYLILTYREIESRMATYTYIIICH